MKNISDYKTFKSSIRNKHVLVWGLGLNSGGVNVAKFFSKHGALVKVIDTKTREELLESVKLLNKTKNVELILGGQNAKDFLWADLIIRNPAIPPSSKWIKFIKENNLQIDMELNLFLKYYQGTIIGITGTRGKSTTTALIYETLKATNKNVFTGGNNKLPLLNHLDQTSKDQFAVIEMSSFQLSSVNQSPDIAVVTNIYPDHLNWHPDMADYISAKQNIVRFQDNSMKKILNTDDKYISSNFVKLGGSELIEVGKKGHIQIKKHCIYLDGTKFISESELKLKGDHNLQNLSLAVAVLKQLSIDDEKIKSVARSFNTLEFRQQVVKKYKGITFINDSCATMPEGLITALDRFKRESKRIYLIAGGVNKNLNLKKVAKRIDSDVEETYFLDGSFYNSIAKLIKNKNKTEGPFTSLQEIMNKINNHLSKGDCVLFSPGAASFNLFQNEWDRGRCFNEVIKVLYK